MGLINIVVDGLNIVCKGLCARIFDRLDDRVFQSLKLLRVHVANLAQTLAHLLGISEHIAVDTVANLVGIELVIQLQNRQTASHALQQTEKR